MADTIQRDRTHPEHLDSQPSRSLISRTTGHEQVSVIYSDGIPNPDFRDDPSTRRQSSTSHSNMPNFVLADQSRSEQSQQSKGSNQLKKPSLPVASSSHSLSSEVSPRDFREKTWRLSRQNCEEFFDANGNKPEDRAKYSEKCPDPQTTKDENSPMVEENNRSASPTPAPTAGSSDAQDTNTPFRRRKVQLYEAERLTIFENDPQIEEIEKYRVFCRFCQTWVQLRTDRPYCPLAWTTHKLQCRRRKPGPKPGPAPKRFKRDHATASAPPLDSPLTSSVQVRRTEEERVKFLVSDPHATTVEAHRILCAICNRWIQLRKNSTYCTAPWVQHVRKCATRHNTPRENSLYDMDLEDELDSEDDGSRTADAQDDTPPQKRPRGRPRKRKIGQSKETRSGPFTLRPIGASPSPSIKYRGNGRRDSPPRLNTPSPPLDHPYNNDKYWFPALPPMSSYYSLYAGSQYNEEDDTYSLYFHAQPPTHQVGPTPAQSRFRTKGSKQPLLNPGSSQNPGEWPGAPPPGAVVTTTTSPGPDGQSPQSGRAWIVWRLKNYANNTCPMDTSANSESHSSAGQRASSEVSGSGSEPLPMFRSGTWPHLMGAELNHRQKLSPYVPTPVDPDGQDLPHSPGTRPQPFAYSNATPSQEDPGPLSFSSNVHRPAKLSESFQGYMHHQAGSSQSQQGPPHHPSDQNPNIDPRCSEQSHGMVSRIPKMPIAPEGPDLDSPECRLGYTFEAIAYLFSTSFKGADDMSLEILTAFLNRGILLSNKMFDYQEVSQLVGILGERKQLVFTKEGGVRLSAKPS